MNWMGETFRKVVSSADARCGMNADTAAIVAARRRAVRENCMHGDHRSLRKGHVAAAY